MWGCKLQGLEHQASVDLATQDVMQAGDTAQSMGTLSSAALG